MCARSDTILGDKEAGLSMGYWGSTLYIGDLKYSGGNDGLTRDEAYDILMSHDKTQLAEFILNLRDNGCED